MLCFFSRVPSTSADFVRRIENRVLRTQRRIIAPADASGWRPLYFDDFAADFDKARQAASRATLSHFNSPGVVAGLRPIFAGFSPRGWPHAAARSPYPSKMPGRRWRADIAAPEATDFQDSLSAISTKRRRAITTAGAGGTRPFAYCAARRRVDAPRMQVLGLSLCFRLIPRSLQLSTTITESGRRIFTPGASPFIGIRLSSAYCTSKFLATAEASAVSAPSGRRRRQAFIGMLGRTSGRSVD